MADADARIQELVSDDEGDGGGKAGKIKSGRELPAEAVQTLKAWLLSPEHFTYPYPTPLDQAMLMAKTGMDKMQLKNWFTNARRRLWKPMLKKQLEQGKLTTMQYNSMINSTELMMSAMPGATGGAAMDNPHLVQAMRLHRQEAAHNKKLATLMPTKRSKESTMPNAKGEMTAKEKHEAARAYALSGEPSEWQNSKQQKRPRKGETTMPNEKTAQEKHEAARYCALQEEARAYALSGETSNKKRQTTIAMPNAKGEKTAQEKHEAARHFRALHEAARAYALSGETSNKKRPHELCVSNNAAKKILCTGCHENRAYICYKRNHHKKESYLNMCNWCINRQLKAKQAGIDSILALPRKCQTCREFQGRNGYFAWQWELPNLRLDLLDITEESVATTWVEQQCKECQAKEKLKWMAQKWQGVKKIWAEQRGRALEIYDFPDNEHFAGFPKALEFTCEEPDILGKYQILFHYGESYSVLESRTVHNSFLTIEKKAKKLHVSAQLDKTQPRSVTTFNTDFTMTQYTPRWREQEDAWRTRFNRAVFTDQDEARRSELSEVFYNAHASLKVIQNRVAAPWQPWEVVEEPPEQVDSDDEEAGGSSPSGIRQAMDLHNPVKFHNLQEADKLMEVYRRGHGAGDWLCRHKGLTPEIAKRIHDFVAWKPCPVFFFEPGDLLFEVEEWAQPNGFTVDQGKCYSKYVARKVKG